MPNVQGQVGQTVATAASPRVNLMPPEIAEAARFRRFQFAMGGAVLAAVVVVGGLYAHAHSGVTSAKSQLDAATAQHAQLQSQLDSLQSVQSVYSQVSAKRAMLQQAMGSEIRWSYYLTDLSLKIPDHVWLTSVSATEAGSSPTATAATAAGGAGALTPTGIGTVTFAGTAFSHDDVATWLETLANEKGYSNPYFSNSTESNIGARKTVNFSSSVVLTDAAKSGRYTTPAGS